MVEALFPPDEYRVLAKNVWKLFTGSSL
eukprot:SAG31_NODE_1773_length_7304_cov_2.180380_11_plen_27_part_01